MGRHLTAARIRALKAPGLYADGHTLYLRVAPGGSKSWIQRLVIRGRRRDLGLGGWPLVTLAEARDLAFENRRLARRGGDPVAERQRATAPTFAVAAELTYQTARARWRSDKVAENWKRRLDNHVLPALGAMNVDDVGREDVLRVLLPMWTTQTETARKVRAIIRATLAWAEAHGHVGVNVAGPAINGALPAMPSVKGHHRALPHAEIPAALETIEATGASIAVKSCIRFVVLTACRSGEARGAKWSEIDLDAREWRIPGERMKAGGEHRVPLSDAAVEALETMLEQRDDDFVFPSPMVPGKPLSDMSLTRCLRSVGLADRATVHGFRSSFRDWCADTGKPREVAESALAHVVGGVEGSYFRSDIMERRRGVMEAWARYATATSAEVVKLHG